MFCLLQWVALTAVISVIQEASPCLWHANRDTRTCLPSHLFITAQWNRVVILALWGKGCEHFRLSPCSPYQQVSYLKSALNSASPGIHPSESQAPDSYSEPFVASWCHNVRWLHLGPPHGQGTVSPPCSHGAKLFLAQAIRDIKMPQYYSFWKGLQLEETKHILTKSRILITAVHLHIQAPWIYS